MATTRPQPVDVGAMGGESLVWEQGARGARRRFVGGQKSFRNDCGLMPLRENGGIGLCPFSAPAVFDRRGTAAASVGGVGGIGSAEGRQERQMGAGRLWLSRFLISRKTPVHAILRVSPHLLQLPPHRQPHLRSCNLDADPGT